MAGLHVGHLDIFQTLIRSVICKYFPILLVPVLLLLKMFSDASFHEKFTFIRQFVCCCCFSFAVCAFVFRKHLSNPTHWRFPPVFSYKSCMVSAFVFGSLTHFNPIFMSDVKCPSCLLWMWISNFFSYVLSWKELSFPSPPVEWSWHPWSK